MENIEEVLGVQERLDQIIYELETLQTVDQSITGDIPSLDAVVLLGRRIAATTIPPTFLRFNTEVGPLEAIPSRFRVPFPTVQDFKFSVLNHRVVLPAPPAVVPQSQSVAPTAPGDEYADDF